MAKCGFLFKDRSGFKAELKLSNLNIFVNKLSEELKFNTSNSILKATNEIIAVRP